jgi:DNA-binding GntR family transcriptional regulator
MLQSSWYSPGTDTERLRRDRAYAELKERLLLGGFPPGVRLVEKNLATALRVSRTPVREALLQLTAEGLVQCHPRDGFWPHVPNLDRIRDLHETRLALEFRALERPATPDGQHDRARLEGLRTEWRALEDRLPPPDTDFVIRDEAFHVGLAESAGNRVLAAFLRMVQERMRLVRLYDNLTPERVEATVRQHVRIADALLDGDVAVAREELTDHLVEPADLFVERAARALARMASPSLVLQA